MGKKGKNSNLIKHLIIIVTVIIVILFIIILFNKNTFKDNVANNEITENDESNFIEITNNKPSKTSAPNIFFSVDNCIKNYITMLKSKDTDAVLSYLNSDFINENQINTNNVFDKMQQYNNNNSYITIDMYNYIGNGAISYYVKGVIDNHNVYFTVALDQANETFDIMPISEEMYNKIINGDLSDEINNDRKISKKQYNFYSMLNLDDESLCEKYYQNFITVMLANTEETYKLLDEQYKKLRFPTIEKFNEYVNNNREKFQIIYKVTSDNSREQFDSLSDYLSFSDENNNAQLASYSVIDNGDSKQYICLDGYNNYYIFSVKTPGDYVVNLDNHTIDTKAFTEEYDKSSEENKCALNAEKIKDAINTQDYSYIYSKMDNTFKRNKFPSENNLREYMQKQLFNATEFTYSKVEESSGIYEINLTAKDKTEKNTTKKNMVIIMKLLDNRDFTMSFSIQE